ncbi:MAG TPA: hypothetical protein D7I01_03330, partial [Candidatus Poseidoniales archaeon]
MISLAQTAYIEVYRGWQPALELQDEEEQDVQRVASPPVCAATSRTSGTAIHVDVVQGDDTYPGTTNCPKASLGAAVTLASSEAASNPEIVLHAGLYHENVSVNNLDNLLIRAADGERVVFDGTRSITEDLGGVWGAADSDGIQEVTLTQDGWQVFLAYEEQVPARWPNAQFSDETVFNRSYWAEGTLTGSNNAYGKGWLTDAGPEAGVHTGLNETVNATGLDPVGSIAVMNLGSFRSNSRIITDWNPNNGTFAYDGDSVGWKTKHHAYFLEGKRELIDQDGEWWYNTTDDRLHYKTPSGQDANDLDLRVKVQPFAISVDGSDGVTVQGIDFFGTTVNFNNCDGCSFTNATLEYPSTSKRGLGIAGESEDDRWMTRFYRSKNTFVDRISITNTDGGAIEFQGSAGQSHNNTVNNSYFHAIDWSAADQKGLMVTIYEGGRDMTFSNNTVHLTGASSVLSIGDAPQVLYNEVWDVGYLQTDGAVVQIMQGEAPGAVVAYNWIHDIIKYGARFDAPVNEVGEGMNGTMHHNVIWNAAGGLMVKGDYHDIHNNTVFNSTASKNDIIFLTDGGINNKNSTLHGNAVDSVADHRSDDVFANPLPNGSHWANWNGYQQGYDGMFEARNQHSCAIYDNGSLYCWGRNDYGQLGLENYSGREELPMFVDLGAGKAITSLGIGTSGAEGWEPNAHTCAVLNDGQLKCWGANAHGQLGIGNTTTANDGVWLPTAVDLGSGLQAVSVAVASSATCALLSDQSVKCWGRNNHGQLGLGNVSSINHVLTPHAVTFDGQSKPVSLHAGTNAFCALMDSGSLTCWGRNSNGELGLGNTTSQDTPVALSLPTGRTLTSVSMGKNFMCVSYDNGSVACTGVNGGSQLGTGSTTEASTLQHVVGLDTDVVRVDVAQKVGCAHLTNGSVVCWGTDEWGLFGNSTTSYGTSNPKEASTATEYVAFPTGRTAASISVSGRQSCAVLDNGELACWGRNHKGQLGLGNATHQFMPVVVSNVSSLRSLQVHEMLVDPANKDFRPAWGSPLHRLGAGAYDAGVSHPWTAGISWTYTTPDAPVAGCMLEDADNYDADATLSDGSCSFASYTPPSTLDLRLHLDPTNSSSYSGSGTNVADLSGFDNDGTVAAAGPTWDGGFTRFSYDGACTGSTPNLVCDEIEVSDSTSLRPGGNDWSVSVWFNASTHQHSVILGAFDDGGAAVDVGWAIRMRASGAIYANVGTTSNNSAAWTSEASIDTDRWYHVVLVADPGNTLRLYVDGQNVGSGSLSGSGTLRNVSNSLFIASYNGGEYSQTFDGQVGSVMAFADALNATTVNQIYNASKGVYSNTTTLSFPQSSPTLLLGQTYSFPLTVANGEITTSYSLTGTLPSGMNFESSNGTIWGTPTAAMTSTTYTLTANNSAGSYSTSFSLTSQHLAPYDLAYAAENMTLEKGTAMTPNLPSVSGGSVTSWEIEPSLPNGLTWGTSDGKISGTPTGLQTTTETYTVWANNSGGWTSTQVNITVNDAPPGLTYGTTEITGTKNVAISPSIGPTTSGGTITSWEISPSPGTAFTFNSATGTIGGTPAVLLTRTQYTIWANNSGGDAVAYVNVTINDVPPNTIVYSSHDLILEKGTTMSTTTPAISGGSVTSWEIDPSIPSGLSFSSTTGAISGTPSVLQTTAGTYTIWANNSGGWTSTEVNITINDQVASIAYPSIVEVSNDRAMTTVTPTNTGGAVTSWEIDPALPSSLSFGSTNGSIWGTPTGLLENVTYTVYANNSGGSPSTTFTLGLNWTLTPSAEGAFITRNSSIASDITWEWDYDPLEAQNLSLVTGEWNTCALDSNQNVFCWGRNGNGQIG